jgi:hypothetical protein
MMEANQVMLADDVVFLIWAVVVFLLWIVIKQTKQGLFSAVETYIIELYRICTDLSLENHSYLWLYVRDLIRDVPVFNELSI